MKRFSQKKNNNIPVPWAVRAPASLEKILSTVFKNQSDVILESDIISILQILKTLQEINNVWNS